MKVLSLGGAASSDTEISSGLRHTEEASVFQGWMVPTAIKRKKTLAKKALDQSRKPRADALRNRERVLEAARTVFSTGGPEASLEAVAKTAGVRTRPPDPPFSPPPAPVVLESPPTAPTPPPLGRSFATEARPRG